MSENKENILEFNQKADMAGVFVQQLNRKNQAGTYDYTSGIAVTLNNLPTKWVQWVLDQEDLWTDEIKILIYKRVSGVRLGHKNNPLVWNDENTDLGLSTEPGFSVNYLPGEIDWSDPNIAGSINTSEDPEYVIEEYILFDKTKPVLRLQGEIDWTDSRIYSPYRKIEYQPNYEKKDAIVSAAAEYASLTWTNDRTNSERKNK